MTGPVKASQVEPQAAKTKKELAGEAARRAVTEAKTRTKKPKANGERATANQLRAGLDAKARIGGARGIVRRAQISEAVKARLADNKGLAQ